MTIPADIHWPPAPETPVLADDEVHVWRASLDLPASELQHLHQTLAPDELHRARRFRFHKDRDRFVAARSLLRAILSRYLNADPARLRFSYGPNGKPYLADTTDGDGLSFNLSRRDGLALYAITRGREVGIDLERICDDLEPEQIAEQFFSPREVAALRMVPAHKRRETFFAYWACKEAYTKARGTGLSLSLDQFDVLPATKEPEVLLSCEKDPKEALRWVLRSLSAGSGYSAALAVQGHGWRLECWQWNLCHRDTSQPVGQRKG